MRARVRSGQPLSVGSWGLPSGSADCDRSRNRRARCRSSHSVRHARLTLPCGIGQSPVRRGFARARPDAWPETRRHMRARCRRLQRAEATDGREQRALSEATTAATSVTPPPQHPVSSPAVTRGRSAEAGRGARRASSS